MRWVQMTIPAPAAEMLRDCLKVVYRGGMLSQGDEKSARDLIDFMEAVAENPAAFPPTGTMATSIKMRTRRMDGVRRNDGSLKNDEPRSKKHARPTRHARRLEAHKQRRKHRAEAVAAHNLSHLASNGLDARPQRKGILSRIRPRRAEG